MPSHDGRQLIDQVDICQDQSGVASRQVLTAGVLTPAGKTGRRGAGREQIWRGRRASLAGRPGSSPVREGLARGGPAPDGLARPPVSPDLAPPRRSGSTATAPAASTGSRSGSTAPADQPADVGAGDFTLEWWMRAAPGRERLRRRRLRHERRLDHRQHRLRPGRLQRRRPRRLRRVARPAGAIAFGVSAGSAGNTICGATMVADGEWHHVAVTRQTLDGQLRIYVDGVLDAEGVGNVGPNADVSATGTAGPTAYPDSDPFLVIGAEKHDAGSAYPVVPAGGSTRCRLSTVRRYTGDRIHAAVRAPSPPDGNTAALYHLDEGAGDVIGDASGGGSHGTRDVGGQPRRAGVVERVGTAGHRPARRPRGGHLGRGPDRGDRERGGRTGSSSWTRTAGSSRTRSNVTRPGDHFTFLGDVPGHPGPSPRAAASAGSWASPSIRTTANNRYFFVYYTAKANGGLGLSDGDVVIARYRAADRCLQHAWTRTPSGSC